MNDISMRESYLSALHCKPTSELMWAPNFDYWLTVNSAQGTVPAKYASMYRNDIVRSIGAAIWNRVSTCRKVYDSTINEKTTTDASGKRRHEFHTPIGDIWEEFCPTETAYTTKSHTTHFVKDLYSLKVLTYVVKATSYEFDFTATEKAKAETGNDGVVVNNEFCVPFIQFAKTDAGYLNGFYLWNDYPGEVDALIAAYQENDLLICRMLIKSPADIIATTCNMDEWTMPPSLFKRYAIPFYHACKEVIEGSGKLFEAHWCGRTQHLLPLVKETGLDVVEAIVTAPMADITLDHALNLLDGKVALQGGIPSILVCPNITSQSAFEDYIERIILPQRGRKGFVLGMSDNVPPDADFSRVASISKLIKG